MDVDKLFVSCLAINHLISSDSVLDRYFYRVQPL